MAPPRRRRPEAPAPEPARYGTYVVVGPHPVLGKKRGEQVELEESHAARLMRAGHVEPAPPPDPDPPPKPKSKKKPAEPRQSAGLSHAQDQTVPDPKDESSAELRPQQEVKEAGDG
ncbi:hypothetical protein FHX37_0496 [Haloactinospora alba]|uniref:Uncharacterized protein n=1 Tax=Haloactinospora alba TaxID=405555 RepID=A0A543NFJ8_9ACTN|nr:hypothetical protein [Haloactinospora alba]TQN30614.1 hypothetical protein FHX37_0496 [Haloactinospora alba]